MPKTRMKQEVNGGRMQWKNDELLCIEWTCRRELKSRGLKMVVPLLAVFYIAVKHCRRPLPTIICLLLHTVIPCCYLYFAVIACFKMSCLQHQ